MGRELRRCPAYRTLLMKNESGQREVWTYERLSQTANQLANGLVRMGVKQGDRVAVIMGQRPETLVAHIAIYSVGAVILPLSSLFGPRKRLSND